LINALQLCNHVEDFAELLGTKYSKIAHYYYNKNIRNYYVTFYVPKKSGGVREISAPKAQLKNLQSKIATLLLTLYNPVSAAHGFVQGRSILSNAKPHVRKKYVFNVDIQDFFGSITFPRVYGLLKSPPYNIAEPIAATIAHLCTLNGALPQGAPTSPVLSNMICKNLDRQLHKLAINNRASYSRYADDITFSFSDPKDFVSEGIVSFSTGNGNYSAGIGTELNRIIADNGFKPNPVKTRLQDRYERQVVTGLVVNKKVNVPREFIRKTCAMMHSIEQYGLDAAQIKLASKLGEGCGAVENVVYGRILFIKSVVGVDSQVYNRVALRFNKLGVKKKVPVKNVVPTDKKFAEWAAPRCWVIETDDSQGSGFMVAGNYLITCAHVVGAKSRGTKVVAYRPDVSTEVCEALVCYVEPIEDVAILKVCSDRNDYEEFHYGHRPYSLHVSERVKILGFPQYGSATGGLKINSAKVLSNTQPTGGLVYIDKELYSGNSGGPVVDEAGLLVGMVSKGNSMHIEQPYINHSAFTSFAKVEACLASLEKEMAAI